MWFIWWIWIVVAFRRHSLATQTSRCFLFLLPGHSEIFAAFLKHKELLLFKLGQLWCSVLHSSETTNQSKAKCKCMAHLTPVWNTGTPNPFEKKSTSLYLFWHNLKHKLLRYWRCHITCNSKAPSSRCSESCCRTNLKMPSGAVHPNVQFLVTSMNSKKMEGSQRQLHACLLVLPQKLKPLAPALANSLNFLISLSYLLYIYIYEGCSKFLHVENAIFAKKKKSFAKL